MKALLIRIAIVAFGFPAFGATQFQAKQNDFHPNQIQGERQLYIQETKCDGKLFGIVYAVGGFALTPPQVLGMCSWESRFNLNTCLDENTPEVTRCWGKAIDYYGLSYPKTPAMNSIPDIDSGTAAR